MKKISACILIVWMILQGREGYAQQNSFAALLKDEFAVAANSDAPLIEGSGKAAETKWDRDYRNVKPPFRNVEVAKTYYTVNTAEGAVLTVGSGTSIRIPQNGFVDKNGKRIEGNVQVDYREFRDQADILVSGIPMKYTANGETGIFESAGMFELNASANGEEVFLAPGKLVSMDFASVDARPSFNLYAYDDAGANWKELGSAGAVRKERPMKDYRSKYSRAQRLYSSLLVNSRVSYDSTRFASRFSSTEHFYTHTVRGDKKKQRVWVGNKVYSRKLVRLSAIRKTKEGDVLFSVRSYARLHPEMNAFYNMEWVAEGYTQTQQLRKEFSGKTGFSDIRIVKNGDGFIMELKSYAGIYSLKVHPVQKTSKGVVTMKDNGRTRYKIYSSMLSIRERKFNKRLEDGALDYNEIVANDPGQRRYLAWVQSKHAMNRKETAMNFDAWLAAYEEAIAAERKEVLEEEASADGIIRSLQLDGFGIFNCDQVFRLKDPILVKANYQGKDAQRFAANRTYLVDDKINAVLTYTPNEDGTPVSFSPYSNNRLMAVNDDGTVVIYTPEQFRQDNFRDKSSHTFKMTEPDTKVSSVADVRKLLGL